MDERATTGQKRRRLATVEAPIIEEMEVPIRRQRIEDRTCLPAEPVATWSTEKVVNFLKERGITEESVLQSFHDNAIKGKHLAKLDKVNLADMGISAVGIQMDILAALKAITSKSTGESTTSKSTGEEKVFNDPIHGHIELHPLMVKVIDTPQFQRLRYIKQLGGGYYVFPGASHNRFEHSIGVGHLAGELVETLQRKQPELDITDEEVLCVKLAGLCHDLGHGPFSHLFDGRFIPRVLPGIKWKHENASVMMFDHLIAENGLMEDMKKYGLDDHDMDFIKELLISEPLTKKSSPSDSNWPYIGRPESKSFLYEIVANKKTGNDVDKWDYFARDCHCLGLRNSFDVKRHMKFARVISVDGKWQICTRDKEVSNLYEMFHTRNILHRRAYQHKTSNVFELMITEALIAANDYLMIPGKDDKGLKMSEAIWDPHAYAKLTDQIVQQIQFSTDPQLQKAKDIIKRVEKRQLYKYIGQTQQGASEVLTQDDVARITSEIVGCLTADELDDLPELSEEDILVVIATFDYGMKDQNPIDHMRFYVKDNLHKAVRVRKDQVSQMLPPTFREQQIRVFSKKLDKQSIASARKYFISWCKKQNCITPKGAIPMDTEFGVDETTPYNSPYATPLKQEPSVEHHSPNTLADHHVRKLF